MDLRAQPAPWRNFLLPLSAKKGEASKNGDLKNGMQIIVHNCKKMNTIKKWGGEIPSRMCKWTIGLRWKQGCKNKQKINTIATTMRMQAFSSSLKKNGARKNMAEIIKVLWVNLRLRWWRIEGIVQDFFPANLTSFYFPISVKNLKHMQLLMSLGEIQNFCEKKWGHMARGAGGACPTVGGGVGWCVSGSEGRSSASRPSRTREAEGAAKMIRGDEKTCGRVSNKKFEPEIISWPDPLQKKIGALAAVAVKKAYLCGGKKIPFKLSKLIWCRISKRQNKFVNVWSLKHNASLRWHMLFIICLL